MLAAQSGRRRLVASAFLLLAATFAFAQAGGRRVALVVGNGSYAGNALRNPPNDARDVAAALKDAGFETSLVVDADLTGFEKAVKDFAAKLKGADTGLFYYAGHGVQIEGMNYLIPVRPKIEDALSVKAKAVAVDTVVGQMEESGVRTALVFLDCCRDNPFPGASRSATRGLAVVATPRTTNSLIAYATSPGDTAQDGEGRNGVFSGAFLKRVREPGLELGELMRKVKAEVASATANRQQPRVDDGMKESFYFTSPEVAASKAKAESDRAAADLAAIDAEIAKREKAIAAAKSAEERQNLETEQQKAKAIEAAKRIEAQNAAREAAARQAALSKAADDEASKKRSEQEELARAASLKTEAEKKRAEVERLSRADDSAAAYLAQIATFEKALSEISSRYAEAKAKGEGDIDKGYQVKLDSLSKAKAEAWESADEFKARVDKQKAKLADTRTKDLASFDAKLADDQDDQERSLRDSLASKQAELSAKTYTLRGKSVAVAYGAFDRDTKSWPVTISSASPDLPYELELSHSIATESDIRTKYTAIDTAIQAKALAAELSYRVLRQDGGERYFVATVVEARVVNLASGEVLLCSKRNDPALWMTSAKSVRGSRLVVESDPPGASVTVNGAAVGVTPFKGLVGAWGDAEVSVSWNGKDYYPWNGKVALEGGKTRSVSVKGEKVVDYRSFSGYQAYAVARLAGGGEGKAYGGGFSLSVDAMEPYSYRFDVELAVGDQGPDLIMLGMALGRAIPYLHGRVRLIPYLGVGLEMATQDIPAAYRSSLSLSSDTNATSPGFAFYGGAEIRYFLRKGLSLGCRAYYRYSAPHDSWETSNDSSLTLDATKLSVSSYTSPRLGLDLVASLLL